MGLTRLLNVAISEGEALDALLRDVLQAGHAAGARPRERVVQLVYAARCQQTHRLFPHRSVPLRTPYHCTVRGKEFLAHRWRFRFRTRTTYRLLLLSIQYNTQV